MIRSGRFACGMSSGASVPPGLTAIIVDSEPNVALGELVGIGGENVDKR